MGKRLFCLERWKHKNVFFVCNVHESDMQSLRHDKQMGHFKGES